MAVAQRYMAQQHNGRGGPSGLADVLEVLLDKGLVIDAFVRVSLVGIELLTVDARIVVASVDTYLRFAEAVNRLDLQQASDARNLGDLVGGGDRGDRRSDDDGNTEGDTETSRATRELDRGGEERADDEHAAEYEEKRGAKDDQDEGRGLLSRLKQRGEAF